MTMTSPIRDMSRKPSITQSYSSELGPVPEVEDDDNMEVNNSVFERSLGVQAPEEDEGETSSVSDTGDVMGSIHSTPSLREVMKTKITYHYMNPFQKYRARRRKPWKLVVQIVKIVLITIQVRFND